MSVVVQWIPKSERPRGKGGVSRGSSEGTAHLFGSNSHLSARQSAPAGAALSPMPHVRSDVSQALSQSAEVLLGLL